MLPRACERPGPARRAVVLLALLAGLAAGAPARAAIPSDAPPVWGASVVRVEVVGPSGPDTEAPAMALPLAEGQALSRRAVRRTVRLLYETRRYEQVRAHVQPVDGGVAVTFRVRPRRRIAELAFDGASGIDLRALRGAAGLAPDDPYRARAVTDAVAALERLYRRRGWHAARATPELEDRPDGRVTVRFRIDEGPRTRLAEARFPGHGRIAEGALLRDLDLRVGEPLDLDRVEAAVPALRRRYREGGYLRVTFGVPEVELVDGRPGWGRLVVPVEPGPRMRLRVRGNEALGRARIFELMALPEDRPLTLEALQSAAARVRRRYLLLGYPDAQVTVAEEAPRPTVRRVTFTIQEGTPLAVASIAFEGAEAFPQAELRQRVCDAVDAVLPPEGDAPGPDLMASLGDRRSRGTRPGRRPPPRPDPCTVWLPDVWRDVGQAVADLYRARGWLSARVAPPVLVVDPKTAKGRVTYAVTEGVRTRVASVQFAGVRVLAEPVLRRVVPTQPGRPLSPIDVEEGRLALRSLHAESGRPFARIQERVTILDDGRRADVLYEIDPGPAVRVGRIIVRGHRRATVEQVRARLAFEPGDSWDLLKARQSQQNLLAMGLFRSASIRLLEPEEPAEVMDVVVSVSERSPRAAELGFGVSNQDGPRVFAEYADLAFSGGTELHARAKVNDPIFASGQFFRTVQEPFDLQHLEWETHLGLRFPALAGARTDLQWERDNRTVPSGRELVQLYRMTRIAGAVGVDRRLTDRVSASLELEVEFDDLMRGDLSGPEVVLTQIDRERLRLEDGQWLVASLKPGVVMDLRDDPISPTEGWLLTGALDWSRDLGIRVEPMHFLKAVGSATRYQPGPGRITFAFSASGGVVLPLRPDNHTIGPKRFFLGGAENLRGFPVDSVFPEDQREELHEEAAFCERVVDPALCSPDAAEVTRSGRRPTGAGGEAYLLFKSEVRFPILGDLQGGLFLDLGNLWRDPVNLKPFDLRSTAGAGLRYQTPVGPVALDLGFNLLPDRVLREEDYAVHFAIGLF